ncbi:MAG: hypothetical protein NC905_00700 [Candidatus Omnitrophica bacterium]|nr:hypothetical protein [Candidatus Omnitrophota bacterium]MCM8776774.1 hypothetical protein [Candidatus Omnitrophota bacterium]
MEKEVNISFPPVSLMFVLNGRLKSTRTKAVIRDAFEKGCRSVIPIPHSEETMGCRYLSSEYFKEYSVIVVLACISYHTRFR